MVLVNSLSYGTFLVVVRPLAARYDPIALVAWLFIAAAPMVAPFGIVELAHAQPLHAGDLAYFAFLIAVPTVLAYGLVQVAIRRAEATLVASYIYLQPVLATIGAMLLLGEQPTLRTVVCGAIVLAGVWLAANLRSDSRRRARSG
jgi:drug/metabolite transporter (DMT)-like permease